MTGVSSQAKVGLFVLLAALLLAYMTVRIEDMDVEPGGYRLIALLDSAAGLEEAAQIKVAGVDAGRVEKIELLNGRAKLTLYLNPGVVVHTDSVITARNMGLLGEKYIEITPGSPDKPRLKDGNALQEVQESADFDQLAITLSSVADDVLAVSGSMRKVLGGDEGQESLKRILDNADALSGDLKEVIKENREQLRQIVRNINRLSRNLDKLVAQNRKQINQTVKYVKELTEQLKEIVKTNRSQLERTLANLEKASQTLNKESPRLANKASDVMDEVQGILKENRKDLKASVARVRQASEKLNKTLASIGKLTKKVEKGEGTLGKLFKDEAVYDNLNSSLKGLKGFFEKGKDLKVFVGVRSEYLFDSDEAKTYISLRLQPRHDKFYLIEVIDDPRGKDETTTTKTTTTPPGGTVTTKEEVNEDELKFSVQIAKKFYDFTIRGGLIESTGGVGLDYEPWGEKRVKFRIEAFDLGADDPHLKFTTNFYLYERVFVNIGMDDIINDEYRSFFVGAGLLFSDQDLKSFLGGMAYGAGAISN